MSQPVRPAGDGARPPLRLAPFRALRYNPTMVPDVGAVTCPPYDVISSERVSAWEAADPHNVVRLILPRNGSGEDRYAHATRDLGRWLAGGLLVRDPTPGLYVYEHSNGTDMALGLVGAVSLHSPDERRILPHEDVFPGPVADRAALMSATAAQLEPILLTYEGDGAASDVADAALATAPLVDTRTSDGATHRVWQVTDAEALQVIAADLAERQALIADGHHRYAAYLALRAKGRSNDQIATDFGLALLVDATRHPLRLGPVHRSVSALPWPETLARAQGAFRAVRPLGTVDVATVLAELDSERARADRPVFALTDGRAAALVADPHPDLLRTTLPADRSELWRSLDASIARELVLAQVWGVADGDARVEYHHQAADAVVRARKTSGVALLLSPPRHADVLAVAARGERMPRKSTSFGPKPRTGLLMRLLDD